MTHDDRDAARVPDFDPASDLHLTRTFDAPPAQVFNAWTDGQEVKRWWGPAGFTCPLARMDVREGGTSLVAMQAPPEFGGQTMYNTWTYTRIIPDRRLDFTLRFSDENGNPLDPQEMGLPEGIPAEVPHVLIFTPLEDGRTKLTVIEYGYTTPEAIELSRQGMEQCLDKLAASLERGQPPRSDEER